MKKVLFLLPLMAVLFLNHCADSKDVPSGGSGDNGGGSNGGGGNGGGGNGGGGGGDDTSYKAYDANNQYLGQVVNLMSAYIFLISPKGYFYNLTWDGYGNALTAVFSSSQSELKDLRSSTNGSIFYQKEAFEILSPSGGYSKPTWFCHEAGSGELYPKSHYYWSSTSSVYNEEYHLKPLEFYSDMSTILETLPLAECDSSKTGIPDNIQGNITVKKN